MNRGVIMEVGKRYAVVMTPDGEFRRIKSGSNMAVGEEIRMDEILRLPRRVYSTRFKFGAGTAAAAIMLLLFVPWMMKSTSPEPLVAAYLTMDINPSIELAVDDEEKVLDLHALNPDGKRLTEGMKFEGMAAEEVAANIMERVETAHYFDSGDGDVIITSVVVDEKDAKYETELTEHVQSAVQQSLKSHDENGSRNVKVTTLSAPVEVREEAKKSGVSSGKMAYYLLAKSEGHEVSLEELRHTSIHKSAAALGGVDKVVSTDQVEGESKLKNKLKTLAEKEKVERKAIEAERGKKADKAADKQKEKEKDQDKAKDKDKPKSATSPLTKPSDDDNDNDKDSKSNDSRYENRNDSQSGSKSNGKEKKEEKASSKEDDNGKNKGSSRSDNNDDNDEDRSDGQQSSDTSSDGRHAAGSATGSESGKQTGQSKTKDKENGKDKQSADDKAAESSKNDNKDDSDNDKNDDQQSESSKGSSKKEEKQDKDNKNKKDDD